MSLNCGIIGLTNSGKTTLFNCMSNKKAEQTEFAYSTNKSNIGLAWVPDHRLQKIDSIVHSAKIVPTTVDLIDIPGLAKGASKGEGIGNKFLNDIQSCDAIIHVVRCFDNENLPHIEGSVDPVRDKEIVDMELQIRDIDIIDRKMEKTKKVASIGDKNAVEQMKILEKFKEHLENFQPIRLLEMTETEQAFCDELFLVSDKPVMYVCNVNENDVINGNEYSKTFQKSIEHENAEILTIAAELESEIAQLDDEEDRTAFLADAGLKEPGVNKLIRSAYNLLNLITFFTAGPKEVRAWTIKKGMKAPKAAGVIHSDLEKGFIRAEVMKYNDFIKYNGENGCKSAGKLLVEGKNYLVQDGDIMHIRFNV